MKVYELTLKIFLLKDIKNYENLEKIANLIDKALSKKVLFYIYRCFII